MSQLPIQLKIIMFLIQNVKIGINNKLFLSFFFPKHNFIIIFLLISMGKLKGRKTAFGLLNYKNTPNIEPIV